jgi:hypothetical protein
MQDRLRGQASRAARSVGAGRMHSNLTGFLRNATFAKAHGLQEVAFVVGGFPGSVCPPFE